MAGQCYWLPALALIVLCVGAQCEPIQPGENLLVARTWQQLQGDEQGSGFNGVHTAMAVQTSRKWVKEVGDIAFSSPVISLQGTVWIGTAAGELIGLDPANGQVTHRVDAAGGHILTTPAVDDSGRVFFLSQHMVDEDTVTTLLQTYDPARDTLQPMNNQPTFVSLASPKLWREFVFVTAGEQLFVFHGTNRNLVAQRFCCGSLVCGVGGVNLFAPFDAILFFIDCITLGPSCDFNPTPADFEIPRPSVAIVDNPTIVDDPSQAIVIMASRNVTAFDFNPFGTNDLQKLKIRWNRELISEGLIIELDCQVPDLLVTTPAVLDVEQVVVGDKDGHVRSFQIDDGSDLWDYDFGEQLMCPPVASLRQIYLVGRNNFAILDSNGDELVKRPLQGTGGGAAMSLDFVHVMTSEGIHSIDINPASELEAFDDAILNESFFGRTTPAIDRDGTVYLSTPNGFVFAYGPMQFALAIAIPEISWIAPSEGGELNSTAGQTLQVTLGGNSFTGDVAFRSDVDGTICKLHVDNATEASCVTLAPLTIGEHVLTAFATDTSGGSKSAQVTVDVIGPPILLKTVRPEP